MNNKIKIIIALVGLSVIALTFYAYEQYSITKQKISSETIEKNIPQKTSIQPIKGNLQPNGYDENYIIYVYATDGQKIYFRDYNYAEIEKDINKVPLKEISGADVATFQPIENGRTIHYYAKDKNFVYFKGNKIENADPLTFEVMWTIPREGCGYSMYAKDKNNVYFKDLIVNKADPKTFEPLMQGRMKGDTRTSYDDFGKDKNHVYKEQTIFENVLPNDFETECVYG